MKITDIILNEDKSFKQLMDKHGVRGLIDRMITYDDGGSDYDTSSPQSLESELKSRYDSGEDFNKILADFKNEVSNTEYTSIISSLWSDISSSDGEWEDELTGAAHEAFNKNKDYETNFRNVQRAIGLILDPMINKGFRMAMDDSGLKPLIREYIKTVLSLNKESTKERIISLAKQVYRQSFRKDGYDINSNDFKTKVIASAKRHGIDLSSVQITPTPPIATATQQTNTKNYNVPASNNLNQFFTRDQLVPIARSLGGPDKFQEYLKGKTIEQFAKENGLPLK